MRTRIFAWIAVVWGAAVVIYGLTKENDHARGAAAAGQNAGLAFGGLLFLVGMYYVVKGGSTAKEE
jgi:hypothetical protein